MSDTCSLFPVCRPLASLPLTLSLVPSQASPVACCSTWPGLWNDWLLDLQQIVNNRQISIMISEQDEVLLSYRIELKVSEGEWGEVGRGAGKGSGGSFYLVWALGVERQKPPRRQAADSRNLHISSLSGPDRCRNRGIIPAPGAHC